MSISKPLVWLQNESGFSTKTVTYSTVLGRGAFAAVFKAKCGELPCAAKILHSILLAEDPALNTPTEKFYQECDYLKNIKHPNVVQYLGVCRDPETQQPVLLMEMMDQSLTHFLEHSNTPLPRRVEVSLCHDVVLALEYLHSINIVHRDLSSNNVLLIGPGSRAKVSDFGMSRMIDSGKASRATTPLTQVPGTVAYMPHEALGANPRYTEKIDIFSFGVLAIQVMTRQFPNPTERFKEIEVPDSPVGTATVPVLETECRKEHINMIDRSHPLLRIALDCLALRMDHRPSAKDLCGGIDSLKEDLPTDVSVVQSELETSAEPNQLLKDRVSSLEQELEAQVKANFEANARCTELEAKLHALTISSRQQPPFEDTSTTLSLGQWRTGSPTPDSVSSISTSAVLDSMYVTLNHRIFEYNIRNDKWIDFPRQIIRLDRACTCALSFFHNFGSLVVIAGTELFIMHEGKWKIQKSFLTTTVPFDILSYKNYIILLRIGEASVYLYKDMALQFKGSVRIPKLESSSVRICNDALYYFASAQDNSNSSTVFKVSLRRILLVPPNSRTWFGSATQTVYGSNIAPLYVTRSTLVSYNNQLLSVGGLKNNTACGDILLYEEESNRWVLIGNLPTPRYNCLVEVLENQLVVAGGWLNHVKKYDLVEIATLNVKTVTHSC